MLKNDHLSALIVVDIQNDFCPGGALEVSSSNNTFIEAINQSATHFSHVILTQDWHPQDHFSFASNHPGKKSFETINADYGEQILWPDHCVMNTLGAEFNPRLHVPHSQLILRKGFHQKIDSYSAFFENDHKTRTGLDGYLKSLGLENVYLAGLATDFCVKYSAIDAINLGFQVFVLMDLCRGINLNNSAELAFNEMTALGIQIVLSSEVLS
ncbi:MAG: bifunctional nicotinamidase/pyrazinamidase [Pseudomonadota bacterium]